MKNFRLTIGNRIFGGFLLLIILFLINAGVIISTGNKIDEVVNQYSEIQTPSKEAVSEFILLVTRSKMLITNWVYLQSNKEDKNDLKYLQNHEYPRLKAKIQELMPAWKSAELRDQMDTVFSQFETMIALEREVMEQLVSFDDYQDSQNKFLAENTIEAQITPIASSIIDQLKAIADKQQEINAVASANLISVTDKLRTGTVILAFVTVVVGLLFAYFIVRSITGPIDFLKDVIIKLSRGELVEEKNKRFKNDEIGEMALAMDNLVHGLKSTTYFAESIGKGNYGSEFKPLSENDVLGNALIEMRNNLARVAEEDKKRHWATEGLAKFGEILRANNDSIDKLCDEIIKNLVKYLNANQGGLYIIDDMDDQDPYMTLKAVYAWDKKKYIDQKIYKGEGLAGQAWQELDTIYITDVPDDYIKITSGLGDANPSSILIVPLKINEEIMGVVEVASFYDFENYQIEFVEKIAESIASTISSVKINAKTHYLLQESQEMTEQLRSQEEEMRQNMEELQATQEELQRGQNEAENIMHAIHSALATAEFDNEGRIINVNDNFLLLFGYERKELLGEHHRILVTKEDKQSDAYKQFWRDLSNGQPMKGEYSVINKKGKNIWVKASYAPVRNSDNEVKRIMGFLIDITNYKEALKKEQASV